MKSVDAYPWLKKTANELLMMPALPNSFIIEGNKGLGKSELAFDLIQKQLCQENTGCNYCQSCLLFNENTHPEFLLVTGKFAFVSGTAESMAAALMDSEANFQKITPTRFGPRIGIYKSPPTDYLEEDEE